MVKITRVRLRNFKSFRQADIPVADGFSAIVGANASGKSNIVDALMFVFGITSLKMLRAAKLTDLVNHSAPENYAKVEVELQDAERTYTISRTIDKQGRGVVKLDGKKRSLNEVSALLAEIGVRPTGYNIVTQGDVTRVIETGPKQRREIIEEIAGLREFEEKKHEAMRKLEAVDERVKNVDLVLREREAYLEELERERDAALNYNALTGELRAGRATLLGLRIAAHKNEREKLTKIMEGTEKDVKAKRAELDSLQGEEGRVEQKLAEINEKMIESAKNTYATLGRVVEEKRSAVRMCEHSIAGLKENLSGARTRIAALKEKRKALDAQVQARKGALEKGQAELGQVVAELKPFDEHIRKALGAAKKREAELKGQEEKLRGLRTELTAGRAVSEKLAIAGAELQKEMCLIDERLGALKGGRDSGIDAGIRRLGMLEKRLGRAEASINSALQEIEKLGSGVPSAVRDRIRRNLKSLLAFKAEMHDGIRSVSQMLGAHSPKQEAKKGIARRKELAKRLAENGSEAELAGAEAGEIVTEIGKIEDGLAAERAMAFAVEEQEAAAVLRERHAEIKNTITEHSTALQTAAVREKEICSEHSDAKKDAEEMSEKIRVEEAKLGVMGQELGTAQSELDRQAGTEKLLREEQQRLGTKAKNISEKRSAIGQEIERLQQGGNESRLEAARIETRLADMEQEREQYEGIQPLKGATARELEKRIPEVEREIKELGAVNMRAIEGFEEYRKEVVEVREKADRLEKERLAVLDMIDKIDVKKLSVFMQCFNEINKNFSRIYYEFFGGEGRLGLTDAEDPLAGGLAIEAKYSEGMMKNIDAMSGGEKSLTALAFLFAIQSYESAPFYIFDEADAALDMANSMKLARLIKDVSRQLQFISITHNSVVTKEADQLVGVALNKQRSSVVGLRLGTRIEDADKQLNPETEELGAGKGAAE